ncbi:Uncharacterised protein g8313 [Pycnogonum litorale]
MNLTGLISLCSVGLFMVLPFVDSIVARCSGTISYAANSLYSGMSSVSSIVSDHLTVISNVATYLYTVRSPLSSDVSSSLPAISDAVSNMDSWKRMKKGDDGKKKKRRRNTLIMQRLSSKVLGMAQNYKRIGGRASVKLATDGNFTVDDIKEACMKHYASSLKTSKVKCDILAGDQGPSCYKLSQIPNMNLLYVRFIKNEDAENLKLSVAYDRDRKVPKENDGISTTFPKTLSVTDMLKLGKCKLGKYSPTNQHTMINVFKFSIKDGWSIQKRQVKFKIEGKPFSRGTFREAFKAKSQNGRFYHKTWVVKKYTEKGRRAVEDTNETFEMHTRKCVQMHILAENIAMQLAKKVKSKLNLFGKPIKYIDIFMGEHNGEFITLEEFIPGNFEKYVNNDGTVFAKNRLPDNVKKAECLVHFSYEYSKRNLMLMDIQGCAQMCTDPEIASVNLFDDSNEYLFGSGNLTQTAINKFRENHKCNYFCELAELLPLNINCRRKSCFYNL